MEEGLVEQGVEEGEGQRLGAVHCCVVEVVEEGSCRLGDGLVERLAAGIGCFGWTGLGSYFL